ncbi:MAG TPA: DoxX family protein [Candidatus Paceibacterota bacterium]|nr:DoxX family protein [Candidatus Paceibacterota bacterium]
MFGKEPHAKLPHGVRFVAFLLRLVLGASFLYLGYASLFNPQLGLVLEGRSLSGVYAWVNGMPATTWLHPVAQWGFLAIGALLVLGVATRFASFAAIVLILAGYIPSVGYTVSSVLQFVNDELVVIIALLMLIATKAGDYLGLDAFFHFGFHRKKEK